VDKNNPALLDAIAEVYASTFSPDPIEYRTERGLIDFDEEMAIMIQEVVGNRVGNYFMPSYAGVAFSHNEFRWAQRIKRKDGLIRLVPGLGTRAVDRLADDYPVLVSPGQPNLKVNTSIDEVLRYSPQQMDVIDLETRKFETVSINQVFKKYGQQFPGINKIISIYKDNFIRSPLGQQVDYENDDIVVTFDPLMKDGKFVNLVKTLLQELEDTMQMPVDIEFASDGKDFFLLQCRPQSSAEQDMIIAFPKNIPNDQILFTAKKYISDGYVSGVKYIVYVDPIKYGTLPNRDEYLAIGRVVSKLNKILPKRKFVLMGPGRWGSRGDIKLGVNVTYSDINNTAALIEIARQKGNYVPDLSFGTHFFQDLVEARIKYLPLYPDDSSILFNESFFLENKNSLPELLPDYSHYKDFVHVIDIPACASEASLEIILNADISEAMGFLSK